MPDLFVIVGVLLVAFYVALFAATTIVRSGALAAQSRLAVVIAAVDAVLAMVAAHVLLPWTTVPIAVWLALVAAMSAGAAATVQRWGALPTYRQKGRVRLQQVSAALQLALAIGIGAVLLLL